MQSPNAIIGTVTSDADTPSFEAVHIKLKAGQDVRPGALVRIPVITHDGVAVIGRIRSAHEHNPNETPEDIGVRDTLGLARNYPSEETSTVIYRQAEADLIEEISRDGMHAPESLPSSGTSVYYASAEEVVATLGIVGDSAAGIELGRTVSGVDAAITLRRESIQRHVFVSGTTGSGKSYAVGVIAEELVRHHLPVVFIDTQDEYGILAQKLGGRTVEPGRDFHIRISSLTESELIDLLPEAMKGSPLQVDIVTKAFGELQTLRRNEDLAKFTLDDVIAAVPAAAAALTAKAGDVARVEDSVKRRMESLRYHKVFGDGVADWRTLMHPCLAINCKRMTTTQLQSVATAVLRELQTLRLHGHIPPYAAVVDEAHLFVPEGSESPCKQVIRECVRMGRHHGVCMVLITQSPTDIDRRTIRQCNTRLVFALEPDQLDAIRGVRSDATEEMLRALPKMPRGTCLLSGTYESVRHAIPVRIRERRTEDSEGGRAPDMYREMEEVWEPRIGALRAAR